MPLRIAERFKSEGPSFNMTPVIDIVFLLIVFFVVVFQFIGSDDSQVQLPADCSFAESPDEDRSLLATITASITDDGGITFSVCGKTIHSQDKHKLMKLIRTSLDERLHTLPESQRQVVLRIDKNIVFADAQYILAAAAESLANKLRLATLAENIRNKD